MALLTKVTVLLTRGFVYCNDLSPIIVRQTLMPLRGATKHENMILFSGQCKGQVNDVTYSIW